MSMYCKTTTAKAPYIKYDNRICGNKHGFFGINQLIAAQNNVIIQLSNRYLLQEGSGEYLATVSL